MLLLSQTTWHKFIIAPQHKAKKKIYKQCFKNFNEDLFVNNLKNINWGELLILELNHVNVSFSQLIQKINEPLDIHAPYKYSKPKNKKRNIPWITSGIATSIKKKNNLYKKFCRAKDSKKKEELHILYKAYKNLITNLTRRSKESHFKNPFQENSFKIWQGVKEIINLNSQPKFTPSCLKKIIHTLVTEKKQSC